MSCNCNKNFNSNQLDDLADLMDNLSNTNMCNNTNECSCGYDEENSFPYNTMYGHCYVPNQKLNKTFIPDVALCKGTLFPELVSPYAPNQSIAMIDYLKSRNEIGKGCNG